MRFLSENDSNFVRDRFEKELVEDVTVTLFTQPDLKGLIVPGMDCETCQPTEQLLREVSDLSERVILQTVNHREDIEASELANVERIPTILISKGEESNVRYLGIPAGTEFPVLLEAIVNVSSGAPNLNEETLEFLKDLENELTIKVFVTPN
ncbi:MAG: hypothetical protein QF530_05585 [SAR202 cluster bacterium]|jgi:alkyl hydroperoxide reductase subunit AhpF|nr:hypothetical protein [SAR202 cluster bacterium]|tara:strand:- start:2419 stop:2874 length:456 start_codon:yes stop_codon:yes gene_type:complete